MDFHFPYRKQIHPSHSFYILSDRRERNQMCFFLPEDMPYHPQEDTYHANVPSMSTVSKVLPDYIPESPYAHVVPQLKSTDFPTWSSNKGSHQPESLLSLPGQLHL